MPAVQDRTAQHKTADRIANSTVETLGAAHSGGGYTRVLERSRTPEQRKDHTQGYRTQIEFQVQKIIQVVASR